MAEIEKFYKLKLKTETQEKYPVSSMSCKWNHSQFRFCVGLLKLRKIHLSFMHIIA